MLAGRQLKQQEQDPQKDIRGDRNAKLVDSVLIPLGGLFYVNSFSDLGCKKFYEISCFSDTMPTTEICNLRLVMELT